MPDVDNVNDPTEYQNILPDCIPTFHCNDRSIGTVRLCSDETTLVYYYPTTTVLAYPTNTTEYNMVGELQINADKLKTISKQWLIEIEYNAIGINSNKQNNTHDSLAILKLNIKLLDQAGATLNSILVSRQMVHKFTNNIPNPMFKTTLFHMVNLITAAPTAKWIALRHYTMHSWGTSTDSTYAKLWLIPLDARTGITNGIGRKFPTTPPK